MNEVHLCHLANNSWVSFECDSHSYSTATEEQCALLPANLEAFVHSGMNIQQCSEMQELYTTGPLSADELHLYLQDEKAVVDWTVKVWRHIRENFDDKIFKFYDLEVIPTRSGEVNFPRIF